MTTICLTSPSHRVDQVVDRGLWNVGPLLFDGCDKLLDIGRNWNTPSYTCCIQGDISGETLAMQELGCVQPPGIVYRSLQHGAVIMLQHEVMVVDQWHNNGPQDLVTVSLCIQNAINKMHLCLLSITYACPLGYSIHNIDISKLLTNTKPHTLSAICPEQ